MYHPVLIQNKKKHQKKKSNDNLNTTSSPENFNDSNSIL